MSATAPSQHRTEHRTHAQQLADFVVRASYHDLSPQTRSRLKDHVLDTLGCAIGALGGEPVRAARDYVREMGGTPQCTLIGGGRTSLDRAAFFNSTLVRYLDFMDNFLAEGETCHPSDNFGALLSSAEYAKRGGREFLTALAVAYEVQCRLTQAAPIMRNGFDHTTQLSYSVAAGASKLLGLSAEQTANAMSIAGVNCVALGVIRSEPLSQWKGLASAHTAGDALRATLLARGGITGPVAVFEGHSGFNEALETRCHVDWSREGLDLIHRILIKRYNAEVHAQSALEGIIELARQHRIRGSQVRDITIDIFHTAYDIIGGGGFGPKDKVATKEQADHNLFYLAAVALLDGDVGPSQFTPQRIRRRDVQTLMQKVTVRPSRLYTWRYPDEMCCKIVIRLKNGEKYSIKKTGYEGFFTTPMPWPKIVEKFQRLTERFTTAPLRRQIIDAAQNLEQLESISKLTSLLARARLPASLRGRMRNRTRAAAGARGRNGSVNPVRR